MTTGSQGRLLIGWRRRSGSRSRRSPAQMKPEGRATVVLPRTQAPNMERFGAGISGRAQHPKLPDASSALSSLKWEDCDDRPGADVTS